ncbi:MAG TPA: hypothetical protein VMU15_03045 [Anaeromyxobacter sp.]|nr:hypothetical protein [Anaeromyxobacter sp.]
MKRNDANETKVAGLAGGRGADAPRTLRELGLPGELALDLEAAFRVLGATEGDRVLGFRFVTPDGRRHALRQESAPASPAARAA